MDVERRHLRAFDTVADTLSFTEASRRLMITQPALTRTIQQLEGILGVTLLERSSRRVELTDAGRRFHQRVKNLLHDFNQAVEEVRNTRQLTIGFAWALPSPWSSQLIMSVEDSTGVPVRLRRLDDLAGSLVTGEIDAALSRRYLSAPDIEVATLFEEPRVAAVNHTWPLARSRQLHWNELSHHPVIINTATGSTRLDLWDAEHQPKTIFTCDSYDEWVTLIAAGRGIGATPVSASNTHGHEAITFIPLVEAPPAPLFLCWNRAKADGLIRRLVSVATELPHPAAVPISAEDESRPSTSAL